MKTFHLLIGIGLAFAVACAAPLMAPAMAFDLVAALIEPSPLAAVLFLLVAASLVAVRALQLSPTDRFAAPLTGRPELTSLAWGQQAN